MYCVYKIYDKDNFLLYVGCTKHFLVRAYQHAITKQWVNDIAKITVEYFDSRVNALEIEKSYQDDEKPIYSLPLSNSKKFTTDYKKTLIMEWVSNEWKSPKKSEVESITVHYFEMLEKNGYIISKVDPNGIYSWNKLYMIGSKAYK